MPFTNMRGINRMEMNKQDIVLNVFNIAINTFYIKK